MISSEQSPTLQRELDQVGPNLAGNELLRSVFAASGDCIKILDLDGNLQFMSEGGKRVMEVDDFSPLKGCPWPSFWEGQGNADARDAVEAAKAGRVGHFRGPAKTAKGTLRFWDVRVSPIFGSDGRPEYLLSVSTDITAQLQGEVDLKESLSRVSILAGELQHRINNTLAIVSAIARQTFKESSEAVACAIFEDRIAALSKANLLLTQSDWDSAPMREVVSSALSSYEQDQFLFDNRSPQIDLPSKAALALTLALHELGTNAVKYGALSTPHGKVAVSWKIDNANGKACNLQFTWVETGGPTVEQKQRKPGYGSKLITQVLPSDFKGRVTVEYPPSGLRLRLDAPLPNTQTAEGSG